MGHTDTRGQSILARHPGDSVWPLGDLAKSRTPVNQFWGSGPWSLGRPPLATSVLRKESE